MNFIEFFLLQQEMLLKPNILKYLYHVQVTQDKHADLIFALV